MPDANWRIINKIEDDGELMMTNSNIVNRFVEDQQRQLYNTYVECFVYEVVSRWLTKTFNVLLENTEWTTAGRSNCFSIDLGLIMVYTEIKYTIKIMCETQSTGLHACYT